MSCNGLAAMDGYSGQVFFECVKDQLNLYMYNLRNSTSTSYDIIIIRNHSPSSIIIGYRMLSFVYPPFIMHCHKFGI
jgi:hypothetical protein